MKYWVSVAGRVVEVDVDGDAVSVDGRVMHAAVEGRLESGMLSLVVGRRRRNLAVTRLEDGWMVCSDGEVASVRVETERTRRLEHAGVAAGRGRGSGLVRAPMPGLVLRVDVGVGDAVAAGDGLLVLEAMKMENVIRAPVAGQIAQVHVAQGIAVEKATPLLDIEPAS